MESAYPYQLNHSPRGAFHVNAPLFMCAIKCNTLEKRSSYGSGRIEVTTGWNCMNDYHFVANWFMKKSVNAASSASWDT